MSDDNPYVIPEMDPTLRTQIQECNWQVVNVTTPANYFHVLRRQVSASNRIMDYLLDLNFSFHDFLFHCPDTQGIP
jgi:hypothetical protein